MSAPSPYSYRVKNIVKIIDGDTFDCTVDLGVDEFYNCIRCSYGDLKTYRKEINRKRSNEN